MKPYRLKHVPTRLYLDYRSGENCLNEIGKIYVSNINGLNYDKEYDTICLLTTSGFEEFNKADFIKVGVKIEDVPYENT